MGTAQTALTLVQPIAITQISYSLAFLLSLSSIFFFLSFLNLTSKPHFATLTNHQSELPPDLAYMICSKKIQQHSHLQLLLWKVAGENICFALDVHTWVYGRNACWVYGSQCMLGVWGAMQGAQGCPRLPPPPPTALSTRSALPYLVCFCILCCSYFSWGIFLAALQLQEVCIFFAISYIWRVYENRIVWLW